MQVEKHLVSPFIRSTRWLVSFLRGKNQYSSDDEGVCARASIFGSMFALFSLFHFFVYAIKYNQNTIQLDLTLVFLAAWLLFFRPSSARLLWLLMLVSTVSAVAQAPVSSNHTIVRNFVVLGYWLSFFYTMFRGLRLSAVFTNFTTAGQGTLIVMYFFGIFHKINTDFLNPEVSCAVTLWSKMPYPLYLIDSTAMDYLAIYGTFFIEGLLVVMLITKRFRHVAITFGILFHVLLGLSGFAMYIAFTVLSISLHCLFLNEESALRIQRSSFMHRIRTSLASPLYISFGVLLMVSLIFAAILRMYSLVTILMLPVILPFCYAVIRYGASQKPLLANEYKVSSNVIGALLTSLLFLNCVMPYLGLKTQQAVNMFANDRLEGGVSNHLILKNPPGPFKYLEDVATIDSHQGGKSLNQYMRDGVGMVYYELLSYVSDNPDVLVSYTRNNISYVDMNAEELAEDIETILHPEWFRKWFHFKKVKLNEPVYCS